MAKRHYTPRASKVLTNQAEILAAVASGQSLTTICAPLGIPLSKVWDYAQNHSDFAELLSRAKKQRAQSFAEEIRDISDAPLLAEKVREETCSGCGGLGRKEACEVCGGTGKHTERKTWKCPSCKCRKCGGSGVITTRERGDSIERAKLQVTTRQWLMARDASDLYGDKTKLEQSVTVVDVAAILRARREELARSRGTVEIQPALPAPED